MSRINSDLHATFIDNGWQHIGHCHCGGIYREKYSKGGYVIRITLSGKWAVDNEAIRGNANDLAEKLPTI